MGSLDSELAVAWLRRWPDLISLKAARPATIKRFFYQHQIRSKTLVEERLALIAQALALTTEDARVSVAILQLFQLQDGHAHPRVLGGQGQRLGNQSQALLHQRLGTNLVLIKKALNRRWASRLETD